jgi:hypothetical protein
LEKFCAENDIPLLKQHQEMDYLSAVDDFYDSIALGKTELVD